MAAILASKLVMLQVLLCGLLLGSFLQACVAEGEGEGEAQVDLSRLRVKELKKMLDERGLECEGCVEKEHILSRVKETLHLPVLSPEELQARAEEKQAKQGGGSKGGASASPGDEFPSGGGGAGAWGTGGNYEKDMEMQELIKKLNLGDKVKMFRPEDFKKYADDLKDTREEYEKDQGRGKSDQEL